MFAYDLFNRSEWRRAVDQFLEAGISCRRVISLFPTVVPLGQCRKARSKHPVKYLNVKELNSTFRSAVSYFLIPYLEVIRAKLHGHHENDSEIILSQLDPSEEVDLSTEWPLSELVDSALFKCFVELGDDHKLFQFVHNELSRDMKLRAEMSDLKAKLKQMEQEREQSFTLGQIITMKPESKQIMDGNYGMNQMDGAGHGDDALYEKHREYLQAWNVLTDELHQIASSEESDHDDEKQPLDQSTLSADGLMSQFVIWQGVIQQQQRRFSQIDSQKHMKELTVHRDTLSVEYHPLLWGLCFQN